MLDEATNEWLRALLGRHKAVAGTVHVVRGDMLTIAGAINIPPQVQEVTAKIPIGKGMAGLAWQHDKPIQTCNLKDDNTGAVKPGAKPAVALPIHDGSGTVRAVVGLAWMHDNELTRAELDAIASDAASLP